MGRDAGSMDEWVSEWVNGWMDGWVDGWWGWVDMDGQVDGCVN